MSASLEGLQVQLGYRWQQPALLRRALTHRSHGADHNERLEFLGDSVLNTVVSHLLFQHFPNLPEGELSRMRAHLVREDRLHEVALGLGLPALLRLSDGEARGGGAQRPSILADAMEALVGAVYLEAGYEAAMGVVERLWGAAIQGASADAVQWRKDPKTELQEWLQARRLALPAYRIVSTQGQAHDQTFEVECSVSSLALHTTGRGKSRRVAEQEAAQRLLQALAQGPVPAPKGNP